MTDNRPNPDALLREVQQEERRAGRLKIFLGYSPGVGKTYSMLVEAHLLKRRGEDVVVGIAETHKRTETEALLDGLELLPRRRVDYHGIALEELDLDAALARRPSVLLVDELAHTNAPGSRHPKRFHDVEELLAAGIDVYTTVNVQHFESQNDVIAKITGIRMQETVPDDLLGRADEVQVVDIPLEELFERLREGKVYIPDQAKQAMANFFQRGTLVALREITLGVAARKVDSELVNFMQARAVSSTWPTSGKLMLCVAPTPNALGLVRKAYRIAKDTYADWFVVYVSALDEPELTPQQKTYLADAFNLARDFGARVTTLSGTDVVPGLLHFARDNNISSILIGRPGTWRPWQRTRRSPVRELLRNQNDFDIFLLAPTITDKVSSIKTQREPRRINLLGYVLTVGLLALATGLNLVLDRYVNPVALYSVYLVATTLAALWFGTGPSLLAAIVSLLAYDFFFIEPRLTFVIVNPGDMLGALVFFLVSLVVGQLIKRTRQQFQALQIRADRVSLLEEMSRDLLALPPIEQLITGFTGPTTDIADTVDVLRTTILDDIGQTTVKYLQHAVADPVVVLFGNRESRLRLWARSDQAMTLSPEETAVAEWTFLHGEAAGAGTETLASVAMFFIPMRTRERTIGVIGIRASYSNLLPEQRHVIGAISNLASLAASRWVDERATPAEPMPENPT